jgi:hypothetical protein
MSRRLNQEAAKAEYRNTSKKMHGNLKWDFESRSLHIDTLQEVSKWAKDADIVLRNANPLSVYAK